MHQTYQQLTHEIVDELHRVSDYNPQEYFWLLKQNDPKRFERMTFDTNSYKPHSDVLSGILMDLLVCGIYKKPCKYKELDKNLIRSLKIKKIKNNK